MALLTLVGVCFFPVLYVLPLYIWHELPRNHHKTIWRRMLTSLVVSCTTAWLPTWLAFRGAEKSGPQPSLWEALYLKPLPLPATLLPLALTAVLFAGPLYSLLLDCCNGTPLSAHIPPGPAGLRNLVVAPITEEFVFRSCLLSFLQAQGVSSGAAVLLSPLAFGLSHLHHLHDLIIFQGCPPQQAYRTVLLQLGYTTMFGWYAAFLLVQTRSLAAVCAVHAFCNFMGFPPFHDIINQRHPLRIAGVYCAGVVGFTWLLPLLTMPRLYHRGGA